MRRWWRRGVKKATAGPSRHQPAETEPHEPITRETVEQYLHDVDDVTIKDVVINGETVTLIYFGALVDQNRIYEAILLPLERGDGRDPQECIPLAEPIQPGELALLLENLLRGYTVLLFPRRHLVLQLNTCKIKARSVEASQAESTVLGPQNAFIELLEVNLSLIRNIIISPDLKIKTFELGMVTRTKIAILYMDSVANPENVQRVLERVNLH